MASTKPALPDSIKVTLEDDVNVRLRNMVDARSGPPHRCTLTEFIRDAIEEKRRRGERAENKGQPFTGPWSRA